MFLSRYFFSIFSNLSMELSNESSTGENDKMKPFLTFFQVFDFDSGLNEEFVSFQFRRDVL